MSECKKKVKDEKKEGIEEGKGKREKGGREEGREEELVPALINELVSEGQRVISSFRPPSHWDYTPLTKCS